MSRHPLRNDRTCLNCGATVEERFCTRCGQENVEPKESIGHIISHFFSDITHFDSKLFYTLKYLLFRPGFLTREYLEGRRAKYLNPIRMYIFISALFFLALFWGKHEQNPETLPTRADTAKGAKQKDESLSLKMGDGNVIIDMTEYKYNSIREFDSIQSTLPDSAKEKDMMPWIIRHNIRQKEKRGTSKIHLEVDISHDIPKLMFVLLPLFALYVGWFYSRKKYYYVNHAIFSVHFHTFIFLLFLLFLLLGRLISGDGPRIALALLSLILVFVYLVAALRGTYRQSFWLSFSKAMGIAFVYCLTLGIASTLLMVGAYVWL